MSKRQKAKNFGHHHTLQPIPHQTPGSLLSSKSSGQIVLDQPNQTKRWKTIYPQYIDSNLTVQRGRRVAKSKCVSDPLVEEIYNVLAASPHQFEVQLNMHKCYCREMDKENIRARGYIKYRLLDDKQFKNKRQILQYISSMIPKLKSRQNPKPQTSGIGQDAGSSSNQGVPNKPGQQSGSSGGGGKKKNRRK